jgi:hypothetical protein
VKRAAALAAGERFYFTGKPCKRGHVANRYTCNSGCSACVIENHYARLARDAEKHRAENALACAKYRARNPGYQQRWAEKNRAKANATKTQWRAKNMGRHLAYNARWRVENLAHARALGARWKSENRARVRGTQAQWRANNLARARAYDAKRYAQEKRSTPAWAEHERIAEFYANCPPGWHVDHFYPIQGQHVSGLHVLANLQYLPATENLRKSNRSPG